MSGLCGFNKSGAVVLTPGGTSEVAHRGAVSSRVQLAASFGCRWNTRFNCFLAGSPHRFGVLSGGALSWKMAIGITRLIYK